MQDPALLALIRKGDPAGLEAAIDRYTAYVAAVVRNQLGAFRTDEDAEELVSDVFLSLWRHGGDVDPPRLRGWLGATARNAARTWLRKKAAPTVRAEDVLLITGDNAARLAEKKEQTRYINRALRALPQPDREIFVRYYYYDQTTAVISAEMDVNLSTVKSKLARGREKLREILEKEGYICEA